MQGRLEHGRIIVPPNKPFLDKLKDQMSDFPNPLAHDDLLDALAYIDQVGKVVYNDNIIDISNEYQCLDLVAGY